MGANAQTSVPAFTAGQVLTAQQQTEINTGVPVFATTTTRDAAFGGTGEKVLAEGQLAYIEASDVVQYYNGTAWATLAPAATGALTLISATTIGSAVSTVTVSSAFSSTYDNYLITISGGVSSVTCSLRLQLGSTATGYYGGLNQVNFSSNAVTGLGDNNAAQFSYVGWATTTAMTAQILLTAPNLAKSAGIWAGPHATSSTFGSYAGYEASSTQHTAFTITPSTGTLTGGTIRVYGYANS